ncbi:hypothetical protein [Exiguobacterium acetylicum]|uniref:Uncharacterized protein n=1 Tax=Exiguobacterium acetylicum TaxID=41170 RepID=A0ABX8GEX8_EXIAC|nr:hypothetical protein [Exiguobacterium acetylicum]QWB31971.1 hypothetical protein KKI46_17580 [Exiguobacterium acetylicum]
MEKQFKHLVMFPPMLIYFSLQRKKKRKMYLLFKQLAEKKWYKWQWRILDGVMRVYPQTSQKEEGE